MQYIQEQYFSRFETESYPSGEALKNLTFFINTARDLKGLVDDLNDSRRALNPSDLETIKQAAKAECRIRGFLVVPFNPDNISFDMGLPLIISQVDDTQVKKELVESFSEAYVKEHAAFIHQRHLFFDQTNDFLQTFGRFQVALIYAEVTGTDLKVNPLGCDQNLTPSEKQQAIRSRIGRMSEASTNIKSLIYWLDSGKELSYDDLVKAGYNIGILFGYLGYRLPLSKISFVDSSSIPTRSIRNGLLEANSSYSRTGEGPNSLLHYVLTGEIGEEQLQELIDIFKQLGYEEFEQDVREELDI